RRHVLKRNAYGFEYGIKAITGRGRRNHRDGRFSVAAIVSLQEIALLGFGRKTGGGSPAQHANDDQVNFRHDGQPHGLGLEGHARSGGGGDPNAAPIGSSDGGRDSGDFVFRLEGSYPEILVAGQFMKDIGGRSDGVGTQKNRQRSLLGG